MKKLLLFFVLTIAVSAASAQYYYVPHLSNPGNPGGLNTDDEFPVGGGLSTTWATIVDSAVVPAWSSQQTLPFSFQFNGTGVSQYYVSTSGVLTFSPTVGNAPSYANAILPDAQIPDNSVMIWGVEGSGANDNIVTKTFGAAPNRQFWVMFSSYTISGSASSYQYWSIVLEETTNKIYVVDQRNNSTVTGVTVGLQINTTNAITVGNTNALASVAGSSETPIDNNYYEFTFGVQPGFDMAMVDITSSAYQVAGNVSISGTVRNQGSTPITSFDINYQIDGGTVVTATISGVNIATFATYNYTHSTPWVATIGAHTVKAYATNLNGSNVDVNPTDDSFTKGITVLNELIPRIPLFEVFTSSTCPPCNPGNLNYHTIVEARPASEYVSIKYQQDFPGTGDPYATNESVNRRSTYYAINSIPRMEIDGGWDGNANSFTDGLYDDARLVPAQYKLNGTYSLSDKSVSASVNFSPVFNATGAKLYVAILEHLTNQNIKSNGETEFKSVMKKMLPNELGTAVPSIAIGTWDTLSFNYTFKGNYRLPADGTAPNRIVHTTENSVEEFTDLYVIAWIQGSDKVVYQAANLSLGVGIEKISNVFEKVEVFPNPTTDVIHVQLNMKQTENIIATLVDIQGNVVANKSARLNSGINSIDFSAINLASGMYHLMVFDSKGNSSIHKVDVLH